MPIFYKKTLNCGCTVIALTVRKKNDTFELGGHSYNYICVECKSNLSEDLLDDRLENIYKNDDKILKNNTNNWIEIKYESLKEIALSNVSRY